MQSSPCLSVVMPTYNAMPFLPLAVESIKAQTLSDWELIIGDDGSTDNSREYLSGLTDRRIRVYRNDLNCGFPATCNKLVELARGKYIARMDADDVCFSDRLALQVELLEREPVLDVVGCGTIKITSDERIVAVRCPPVSHDEITTLVPNVVGFIHGPNYLITDGSLLGRAEWFRRWRYDERLPYAQDFDLMCRAHQSSTYGNVIRPLYVYRQGGETGCWWSQTVAAYCKVHTLLNFGFYPGNRLRSALGLLAAVARPITAFVVYSLLALAARYQTQLLERAVNTVKVTECNQELSELIVGLRHRLLKHDDLAHTTATSQPLDT